MLALRCSIEAGRPIHGFYVGSRDSGHDVEWPGFLEGIGLLTSHGRLSFTLGYEIGADQYATCPWDRC